MESPAGLHPVPNANGGLFLLPHPRPDPDHAPPDAPPALFPFLHPRLGFDEANMVMEPDNFSRFDSHPFLHHHHQQHQHRRQLSHEGSMRELEDLLSKLNPLAKEFIPPSLAHDPNPSDEGDVNGDGNDNGDLAVVAGDDNHRRKKNSYSQGKRRVNGRISRAQREDVVRRTVYVSDIDQQVTEEQLAALFIACSPVVDCRVCGDPNSVLRFAFVEFMSEDGARAALRLSGTMLGFYPLRVLPSKTAIVPVNPHLLPQSEDERQMCVRTVYCTNIDKKVSQADVKLFFESLCGEVLRLRLLGDYHHSTRIAFVEFVLAESAMNALNCSGAILGSLPIRVNPSKTPVRPRTRTRSH